MEKTPPVEISEKRADLPGHTAGCDKGEWQDTIRAAGKLAERLPIDLEEVRAVAARFSLNLPEHYLSLIETPQDPLWRQAVPSWAELEGEELPADPLREDDPGYSPTPHLTHRYPDRVLLLVTALCPIYCRFCMRKRKTLGGVAITASDVARGIDYIRETPGVREVILSGGDPLMLSGPVLQSILTKLREISHLEIIRIHTRMPCAAPARITKELADLLAGYRPLFLAVHFNHPREITPEAERALGLLADAGLPLNNQAVLLKGVNDDPELLIDLFRRLLRLRVHPYYLHQADAVPGTAHFRVPVERGREIVRKLREKAPDLAMLHYVLDTPGGGGKVPL